MVEERSQTWLRMGGRGLGGEDDGEGDEDAEEVCCKVCPISGVLVGMESVVDFLADGGRASQQDTCP